MAVNSVSGAFALHTFCAAVGLPVPGLVPALAIVVLVEILVAFAGHNFIHAIERWVFPFLAVVFAACCVVIFLHARPGTGFDAAAAAAGGGPVGAFMIAVFFAFAYAASWNPYASDYSRYLPRATSPVRVALAAGSGLMVACGVLEVAGAALATVAGTQWGISAIPTNQFVRPLPEVLVVIAPLAICVGAISANAINLYSSAMSFLSMGIRIGRPAAPGDRRGRLRGDRLRGRMAGGQDRPGGARRHRRLVPELPLLQHLLDRRLPGRGARRLGDAPRPAPHPPCSSTGATATGAGVAAFLLGIAACVPFMNQSLYVGLGGRPPIPRPAISASSPASPSAPPPTGC